MIFNCISDLHLDGGHCQLQSVRERLAPLVARAANEVLIVTGDITDNGAPAEFEQAAELLAPFAGRVVLARGNHDQGAAGCFFDRATDKRWKALCKALGAVAMVRVFGDALVVALDSCCRTVSPLDFAQGNLGPRQLETLQEAINRACERGKRLVVALHHDPISQNPVEKLQDADAFLRLVYGVADLVVFGHTHGHGFTWRCPRGVPTILHRCADMKNPLNEPARLDLSSEVTP